MRKSKRTKRTKKTARTAVLLVIVLAAASVLGGCRRDRGQSVTVPSVPMSETMVSSSAAETESKDETVAVKEISAPSLTKEEYPLVDGSTATLPLSLALYRLTTGAAETEAEVAVEHTKTTNAYYRLINSFDTDLVLAYEPAPSVDEMMKEAGVTLNIKPIGKDALVFMANEGNPVGSLTGQQIKDIYSGSIRNWSDVGGAGMAIQAFQRPEGSGSQTLMDKLVMKGAAMGEAPVSMVVAEMGELLESVAAYNNEENALGYSVYFYARNMYEIPGLRFMKVDGVMPDNQTIQDGSYPYVNEFYAAIREDEPEDSNARLLFDWLTTGDGQALVESLGYVAMEDVEKMSAWESEQVSVGDADISFPEQERLLLEGEYAYGTDGVYVLNETMEVLDVIEDVMLPSTSSAKMVDINVPVLLRDTIIGNTGLYDLKNHMWILDPQDYDLYEAADGQLQGYYEIGDQNKAVSIQIDGANVRVEYTEYEGEERVGSHVWKIDYEQAKADILDLEGNVVKTLDLGEYGEVNRGYAENESYCILHGDGRFVMLDEMGELVFNSDVLGEDRKLYFGTLSGDDRFMMYWPGGEGSFIYDLVQKKTVTQPGDRVEVLRKEDGGGYTVENSNGAKVYASDGTVVLAKDGHEAEVVIGGGYYAHQEDGQVVVEGGSPVQTFVYPISDLDYGDYLAKNTFYLSHGSGSSIYQGETKLMEGDNVSTWNTENYVVLNNQDFAMVIETDSGNTRYQSKGKVRIREVFDSCMLVEWGNYFGIIDDQGRFAMKQLRGYLADD